MAGVIEEAVAGSAVGAAVADSVAVLDFQSQSTREVQSSRRLGLPLQSKPFMQPKQR